MKFKIRKKKKKSYTFSLLKEMADWTDLLWQQFLTRESRAPVFSAGFPAPIRCCCVFFLVCVAHEILGKQSSDLHEQTQIEKRKTEKKTKENISQNLKQQKQTNMERTNDSGRQPPTTIDIGIDINWRTTRERRWLWNRTNICTSSRGNT